MCIQYEWDLASFYQGFDDLEFRKDMSKFASQYEDIKRILEEILFNG